MSTDEEGVENSNCVIAEEAVRASTDRFKCSEEFIIPNTIQKTIIQNLNNRRSSGKIFTMDNKKRLVAIGKIEEPSRCMICLKPLAAKFDYLKKNNIICSQQCLNRLKEKYSGNIAVNQLKDNSYGINGNLQNQAATSNANVENSKVDEIIKCKNCITPIQKLNNSFNWETWDFCNETCLSLYQEKYSPHCSNCGILIQDENLLGKYRVRFGNNITQFCRGMCLENYKNNLKICLNCQDNIPRYSKVFQSSSDREGQNDFCSIRCLKNYNKMNRPLKDLNIAEECFICHARTVIDIEFVFKNDTRLICSHSCLRSFGILNRITPEKCDFCLKYFSTSNGNGYSVRCDGVIKRFCRDYCRNNFIISNRKVFSCHWCKVKKYNFDMIQKYYEDSTVSITCSLICLRTLRKSANSETLMWRVCDICRTVSKGRFCIVQNEGATRYFCSFLCVRKYLDTCGAHLMQTSAQASKYAIPDAPESLAAITNLRPLSSKQIQSRNAKSSSSSNVIFPDRPPVELSAPSSRAIVLIKSASLPSFRNVATSSKPCTLDVGTNFIPVMKDQETLTEKLRELNLLSVLPVPIYVPTPIPMFNLPYLKPLPFPLYIPIPILIPLTVQGTNKLLNKTNEDRKAVSLIDPCETYLHETCEMLVENPKEMNVNDSFTKRESIKVKETDDITLFDDVTMIDASTQCDFGDSPVDIEEHLIVNNITSTSVTTIRIGELSIEKNIVPVQKFSNRSTPFKKKTKMESEVRLKYIYGINAWKHWISTKNEKFESSDLRDLNVEELNTLLAQFVQEVRNPSGEEYSPDTIYYFCLGIQQYLYEHERFYNIFYDEEYEDFISSLNIICEKFPIHQDSKYIVTRIEEEHLWESKQLGVHTPYVLLNTIMFLTAKYLDLIKVEDHVKLSFSNVIKSTESIPNNEGTIKTREFLRYQSSPSDTKRKTQMYQVNVHGENPLRCLVKLYDFYLSKCPNSAKTRKGNIYLSPKKNCPFNNMYWYTTTRLGDDVIMKMFHRLKMVMEFNLAALAI